MKKREQLSVHELQKELHISPSNVFQHLALLRTHKLVTEEGKEVYYSLVASKNISKVLSSALQLICYQLVINNEII